MSAFFQNLIEGSANAKIYRRLLSFLPLYDIVSITSLNRELMITGGSLASDRLHEILVEQIGIPPDNLDNISDIANPNWQSFPGLKFHLCAILCIKLHTSIAPLESFKDAVDGLARKYVALHSNLSSPSISQILVDTATQTNKIIDLNAFMLHEQKELAKLFNPTEVSSGDIYKALSIVLNRVNKVSKQCVRTQNEITIVKHRNSVSLESVLRNPNMTKDDVAKATRIHQLLKKDILSFNEHQMSVIDRYATKLINTSATSAPRANSGI